MRRLEQNESTPVILSTAMGRLSPNVLEAWWSRDREMFGLNGWAFHELRHSHLSALALKGVHPKIMLELAGHASSEITMEIYTHVNMDAKREAAEAVSTILEEPAPKPQNAAHSNLNLRYTPRRRSRENRCRCRAAKILSDRGRTAAIGQGFNFWAL